jgi:AMP deaminase
VSSLDSNCIDLKLMMSRIDRYTRASQSSGNDLTSSNLQPEVAQTPKSFQGTHPASPMLSMKTQTSMNAPHDYAFSKLPPAQQARLHPSASAADMASVQGQAPSSPSSTKEGGNTDRPRRTSSATVGQGPQSPSVQATEDQDQGLTRTKSSVTLDGEPRMFPGVVSGNRRRSMRMSQAEDGETMNARSRFRRADTGSVMEERDTDDDE